jgi:cytochrome c oxidase subunit 2
MTTAHRVAFLVMRISLGLVFLLFGIGKLNNDIWAQTIMAMDVFHRLPWDVSYTVVLIGIFEIVTGICLMIGLFTRIFAAFAALQLGMILVLLKFQETRDIGLLGAAFFMAFVNHDSWGVDQYIRKVKDDRRGFKKYLGFAVVGLLLILTGAFALIKWGGHNSSQESRSAPKSILSGKLENGVRVIDVKASKYKFEPDPIIVKAGEHIRLVLTSADTDHGFAIGELKINVTIPAGKSTVFEFMAPGKGVFTVHCSVYCGPGHGDMSAAFIVVE